MPDSFSSPNFWPAFAAIVAVISAGIAVWQAMSARNAATVSAVAGASAAAKFNADHAKWIADRTYLIGLYEMALYWYSWTKDAPGFFMQVMKFHYDGDSTAGTTQRESLDEMIEKNKEWEVYLRKSWLHLTALELEKIDKAWVELSHWLPPTTNGKMQEAHYANKSKQLLEVIKQIMAARKMHG